MRVHAPDRLHAPIFPVRRRAVRVASPGARWNNRPVRFGLVERDGATRFALVEEGRALTEPSPALLPGSMGEAFSLRVDDLRQRLDDAARSALDVADLGADAGLVAPIDEGQEVWAGGVTYERSRDARVAESAGLTVYDLVYEAERPELFFKALPRRVAGPGQDVNVRSDSRWDVPEPELAVAVNRWGEVVGYTLGNDVSSRSIEGANPLYLPQAKVYERSCALGPAVVPAWELEDATSLVIRMAITRDEETVFSGEIGVAAMRRPVASLVDWLGRALEFPRGVFLLTGTGIVPPDAFTLREGDVVGIRCEPIGELVNTVRVVEAGPPVE